MENKRDGLLGATFWTPFAGWISTYDLAWLRPDILAGLTLWGMLVPEGIAYAAMAGAPHQAGLYTLLASLAAYAAFGTSRQMVSAATSSSSIMMAAIVAPLVLHDPSSYLRLLTLLVLLVGVIFLVSGLLRLGYIATFISEPVMTGFVFGMAIYIGVSQLPKVVGIDKAHGDTLIQVFHILEQFKNWNWTTVALGVGALLLMVVLERRVKRIPSALVALVSGIVAVWMFDLDTRYGVRIVADIPSGLPKLGIPSFTLHDVAVLIPGALAVSLVALSQALGTAKTYAAKYGYDVNPDRDLIGMGIGNIGSGLIGGLVAGGSMSSTAVNVRAGAKTQMSTLVAAVLVLLTLIVLTPLFYTLPDAVLGAIVIHAVAHLFRVTELRRFYQWRREDFWLAMVALFGVITLNLLSGLIIAVVLSLFRLIWRARNLQISILGRVAGKDALYTSIERNPDSEPIPGLVIMRLEVPLFFANAGQLRDRIRLLLHDNVTPQAILIDMKTNFEMGVSSVDVLLEVTRDALASGIEISFAEISEEVREIFSRSGLIDMVGGNRIYASIHEGVQDYLRRHKPSVP